MTISTSSSSNVLLGNGVTTNFVFDFIADSASDIEVIYTDTSGSQTVLDPSLYNLFLNAAAAGQIWGVGGTVAYPTFGSPIANGTSLTISRVLPLTQTITISNQGDFAPQVIEEMGDTLEMQIQQVAARTGQMRGTWASGVNYNFGDVIVDGANGNNTGNYYMCAAANTSTTWATDLAAGDWSLVINIQGINAVIGAYLPLAGGTISGSLTVNGTINGSSTTQAAGNSTTKLATTGFVNGTALTLATGSTAATQSTGDATTKVATDAFVQNSIKPSFRNSLINGEMLVAQAGTTSTSIGTTITYTLDGWFGNTTSGTVLQVSQQNASFTAFKNVVRVQRINGSSDVSTLKLSQVIETVDCIPYQGKTCTVSFYARAGAGFTSSGAALTVALTTGTGTDEGAQSFANGTWTGSAQPLGSSHAITSTLTRYSDSVTIAAGATEIGIVFYYLPVGTAGASDYFEITNVQLEIGALTTYENLPIDVHNQRCFRYYYRQTPAGTTDVISMGGTLNTTSITYAIRWPVRMFKKPAFNFGGNAVTDYTNIFNSSTVSANSISTAKISVDAGLVQVNVTSIGAGVASCLQFATLNGYIEANARL